GKLADAAREQKSLDQLRDDAERVKKLIEGPLQRSPSDPAVYHELGMIALRAGQFGEAVRWFPAARQVDPGHGPTHQVLATYYREAGNPVLAAKHRALARQHQSSGEASRSAP